MTDTTYLRELLAQATPPGQWRAVEGDLEGGNLNDYIAKLLTNRQTDGTSTGRLWLTLAPNDIDPARGAEVCPAMTGDGPRAMANAALVAAAINALPELLDEVDRLSCATYARIRGPRIKAKIRKTTPARGRAAAWKRFMVGVHQRHLDQARGNLRALGRVTALMSAINEPEETR